MTTRTYIESARPLPVFLGECKRCTRPIRIEDSEKVGSAIVATCPECANPVKLQRLYGTVNRMECDIRCEGAAGPNCSCACGGINHGGVWSKEGTILADALAKYRAEQAAKEAKRQTARQAKRDAELREFNEWSEKHTATVKALTGTDWYSDPYPNGFLADLADQLSSHKILSERQIDAAESILAKRLAAAKRHAEQEANAIDIEPGRHTLEGKIVGTWRKPDLYSPYGGDLIMIIVEIATDKGAYTVTGNGMAGDLLLDIRQREIDAGGEYDPDHSPKGYRIRFTATIKPGREKGKGYFKNPRKIEIIGHDD